MVRFAAKKISEEAVETRQNILRDSEGCFYEVLLVLQDDESEVTDNCIVIETGDARFQYYHNPQNTSLNAMLHKAFCSECVSPS